MRPRHCSDERLLALMDGEGGLMERWRTAAHVKSCWGCRARLREFELEVMELERARRGERELWREKSRVARVEFEARARGVEMAEAGEGWAQWWKVPAAVTACGLIVVAGLGVREARVEAPARQAGRTAAIGRPAVKAEERPVAPVAAAAMPEVAPAAAVADVFGHGELAEAELEAIAVLRAYPSLGLASFGFERDGRRGLRITGVAESGEQRQLLLGDLGAAVHAAGWTAELAIPEEARVAAAREGEGAAATPVRSGRPAAMPYLLEQLSRGNEPAAAIGRANEIATGAIRDSAAAWSSAWTLKRLAQRFPDSTAMALSERGRQTLAHIVGAEMAALRAALGSERAVIPMAEVEAEGVRATEIWSAVERVERLTHALMSSGEAAPQDARAGLRELAGLLAGLEQSLGNGDLVAAYWPSIGERVRAAARR